MHGNVWEWCQDWFNSDSYGRSPLNDPTGPSTGLTRIMRGGAWGEAAAGCRSAVRLHEEPVFRHPILGFRVVREVSPRSGRASSR